MATKKKKTVRRKALKKKNWPQVLAARAAALRERMAGEGLDAYLISCPLDIRYLTAFSGEDSWCIVTKRSVIILSDHRFEEELNGPFNYARSVMRKKSLTDELAKICKTSKVQKLGIQAEYLTINNRKAIAKQVGAKLLKETTGWLMKQREIKDPSEIPPLQKAVEIQEAAFKKLLRKIKPGMTEKQVCAILEFEMKSMGADGPSFGTIIGAGPNSSIPHYQPGDVKIKACSPILIDFGALYKGYHSDMTRVVAIGGFPAKIREIYEIVREAQLAGIEAIKPGVPLKDIDEASRKVIRKAGYAKQFRHSLGHGIGLEIHEAPRLAAPSEGVLEPGHVVTVEPGIYLPGIGGVRLEDDILVTQKGHKNLCSLPTDIKSAII